MGQGQQKIISGVSVAVAAVMLAGCGHGPGTGHSATPGGQNVPLAAAPLTLTPDIRACAGVQALIGHITVDVARWSPTLNPFDKAISMRIRDLSTSLDKEAPQAATKHIQAVVHSTALAFRAVSDAMVAKDANGVSRTINGTKVSYRELKSACALKASSDQ